ncbi:MAG: delta 1-pyrroline-5-carboxylate synthetase [Methanobacteriaceae archaeon]|nr:delta 1-pyrroline-5-carboxylate synthetase [Methanobacteriaceae archaeon]
MEWIVKIGGSLFPEYAIILAESLKGRDVLFICGGGDFANLLREFDLKIHFSASATHQAAIMCMDILGRLLSDKIENGIAVYSLEEAKKAFELGKIPVMLPSKLMDFLDPLEHSWRVTSDSISLYFAHLLEAKLLIATDVDGIYTRDPSQDGAQLLKNIDARKLLDFGETSVDDSFAELLFQYPSACYVVNGKYPERVLSIMDGESSIYTFIGGD